MKVLVADDEQFIRNTLRGMIHEKGGHEVFEATHCAGVVEGFEILSPDITVVDLFIKGGGGLQAMREIRQRDASAKVIMIGMTGQNPSLEEACRIGANHYLLKPLDPHWVLDTLTRVAGGEYHPGYQQSLLGRRS